MNTKKTFPFTIRVYGLLIHEEKLLIAEEKWFDTYMLKLPGGGLEYGESPEECLIREFQEECGIKIKKPELLYIPEKFIPARFFDNVQVIPLYYRVTSAEIAKIHTADSFSNNESMKNGELNLLWVELSIIDDNFFSFPGDREMWKYIKKQGITPS
ncbi:MAG: NUDIX hydrolase [Marinilabiliales bacterium]|nr:MAG: NUDIX hydrolase [Marinilabiliales bacterium]